MARRDTMTAKETTIREGGAETVTDKVMPAERVDEVLADKLKAGVSDDALLAGLDDDVLLSEQTFEQPPVAAALSRPDPLAPLLSAKLGDLPADGYILIVSRTAGFRRCGVVHPLRAVYPLDYFTIYQLKRFQAEPELEVMTVGTPVPAKMPRAGEGMPFIGKLDLTDV